MKLTKKIYAFVLAAALSVTLLGGCGSGTEANRTEDSAQGADEEANQTNSEEAGGEETDGSEEDGTGEIVSAAPGFRVDGTRLLDINGNEFVMRGVNHAHAWYANNDVKALDGIAAAGANCVRLVLSDGEEYNRDSAEMVAALITRCKALNMIAVLEVHDGTGSNDPAMIEAAVDYWIEIKDALIGNEAYAILNIVNEWQGSYNRSSYEQTYCEAVARLREAGIQNTIMIDAGGWGQNPKSIVECGQSILDADPLANTMFSIHMYGTAGKDAETIKSGIDGVRDLGLCVCVGEFGWNHSDGDVDEDYIMQYCTEIGVGYLAWSWKGNGGGVEYLDMTSDWSGENLSEEWGEKVVNGEYGIRNTAEICTVFQE